MKINGWFTPSTVKVVVVAIFLMGAWVTSIQADITALDTNKAEKIDQVEMTQMLIRIDDKLDDLKDSVKDLDDRQREISKDVAALKADDE